MEIDDSEDVWQNEITGRKQKEKTYEILPYDRSAVAHIRTGGDGQGKTEILEAAAGNSGAVSTV